MGRLRCNGFFVHDAHSSVNLHQLAIRIITYLEQALKLAADEVVTWEDSELETTSVFYHPSVPSISLSDYVKRILYFTRTAISPVCFACALVHVEKFCNLGLCRLTTNTVFRLFSTAVLVATKTLDDPPTMRNSEFAKVAGLNLAELNSLERIFCVGLNFELSVSANTGSSADAMKEVSTFLFPPRIIKIGLFDSYDTADQTNQKSASNESEDDEIFTIIVVRRTTTI